MIRIIAIGLSRHRLPNAYVMNSGQHSFRVALDKCTSFLCWERTIAIQKSDQLSNIRNQFFWFRDEHKQFEQFDLGAEVAKHDHQSETEFELSSNVYCNYSTSRKKLVKCGRNANDGNDLIGPRREKSLLSDEQNDRNQWNELGNLNS